MGHRIPVSFFGRDVLLVAPDLLGKTMVRVFDDKTTGRFIITETEAYRGEEDQACHASKGRTPRNEVMYGPAGHIYVYLCYGMHWMVNIVTGGSGNPQAVLIRGIDEISGPGRVTKRLAVDKSFYGENLISSDRLWLENGKKNIQYTSGKRIGIDYAGAEWRDMPWRFILMK